ncbi:RNA pyrophosphohydrolase [Enterovirga rhinocerotis]|uniref:RNA pyrophosphohydrolase n=1 Tax=Enterovirga rhinocerotis TaxID=1339210 RepID=A0A4R7C626_9HYPH|nr:RNA pyrophosphohydrolase [Enterovirga rhinocerotis]TDR94020.1 putative (di)nucleoside polyphosphate hydrolase [Enterovirga rhinocerotis]
MSRRQPSARSLADLPYRPCVGITVLNREGLVFLGRRKSEAGPEHVDDGYAWQMPQGGIDPGEDPYAAALRELYEETNIRSVELLAEAPDWLSYDLPSAVAGRAWRGRYRGQTQKWFALRFTGDESEIDIHRPGEGRHKPEFDAWRWERLALLPSVIIPFKRPVYEKVAEVFSGLAASQHVAGEGPR